MRKYMVSSVMIKIKLIMTVVVVCVRLRVVGVVLPIFVKKLRIIFVGMVLLKGRKNVMMDFHLKVEMDAIFYVKLSKGGFVELRIRKR